jgi:hypothetical protein
MSRIHSMKGIRIGRLGAAAIATAVLGIPALARADSVNLGLSANYAVLGFNGIQDDLSQVTVNGNVGVAGTSSLTISTSSQVNGNVLVNSGASFHDGKSPSQNISGSLLTGQNLSGAVADAENAFSTYTALSATQSFTGISSPTIITGNGRT